MKFLLILCFIISSFDIIRIDSSEINTIVIAERATVSEHENWVEYQMGIASWYGPGFHGRRTASGEIYNMHDMTAAHKTLKFGTRVKVIDLGNPENFIIVTINDRGPYIKGRIIDLSKEAMSRLAGSSGLVKVKLEIVK